MAKKKKKNIWWIAAAILIVILMIASKTCKKDKTPVVETSKVERMTIVETIPANGKIQPVTEVKISPDVSGEIVELHVKEGDAVKKGDLIIKIKQDIYLSAVDQAMASLNAARASYKQQQAQTLRAKQNYDRYAKLYELRTVSKAEYEAASAEWDVAQQQLDGAKFNISSAEARVKEARENLLKTTIYSPMDGIISKLSVELGERVVGTSQMAGTEMFRVADFSQMEVLVDVNENDIIRLNPGDSAQITVDAYTDRTFSGVVTEVANSSKTSSTGMSASVQIQTSKAENVPALPISAITSRSDIAAGTTGKAFVFTYSAKDQTVHPVAVKTGLQDMTHIQITDGISDTSVVVAGPFSAISKTLRDGMKVKVSGPGIK